MVESVEVGKYYKMTGNNSGVSTELFEWLQNPQKVKSCGNIITPFTNNRKYIADIVFENSPILYGRSIYLDELEEVSTKKIKVKPISPIKYMVYGEGCKNKSELLDSRGDCEKLAVELKNNSSWTGTIKGYKLIPIFKVETKTTIKKIHVKGVKK